MTTTAHIDCPGCSAWDDRTLNLHMASREEHVDVCLWKRSTAEQVAYAHEHGKRRTPVLPKAHTCAGTPKGAASCDACAQAAGKRRTAGLPRPNETPKLAVPHTCKGKNPLYGSLDPKACASCKACTPKPANRLLSWSPRAVHPHTYAGLLDAYAR